MNRFSLWILDPDFIPSVMILVMSLFVVSAVFTKLITSQRVHRVINGPDPQERWIREYRRLLLSSMREELDVVSRGRSYRELDESEKEAMKDIRQQYFQELRGVPYANRKQLEA